MWPFKSREDKFLDRFRKQGKRFDYMILFPIPVALKLLEEAEKNQMIIYAIDVYTEENGIPVEQLSGAEWRGIENNVHGLTKSIEISREFLTKNLEPDIKWVRFYFKHLN